MREPAFWYRRASWLSHILQPVAMIYGGVAAWRMARPGIDAGIPVICVGNYHVGGAGKTPTTIALVHLLRALGETPVVLSRGYGGRLKGPVGVDPQRHSALDVGDEPLMMAGIAPVVIARDRVGGAALARALGASVLVMDDGFQNSALVKDLALIVVDAGRGLGNGAVFPAGPMRAPLAGQLASTDALIVIGDGDAADRLSIAVAGQGKPVLHAQLRPDAAACASLRGKRVLAFAGIGDPRRFFRLLRASGVDVASERVFDDHHPYTTDELDALTADADRDGLRLVTTQKDIARLGTRATGMASFDVTLAFDDPSALRDLVVDGLERARTKTYRSDQ